MLYEELLESCKEKFEEFFKNTKIFDNQFTWNDYNSKLYNLMYEQNSYDNFKTVKDLKNEVPELKDLCKNCGAFFMPQRNKSIPKYDVILGKQHEESLMEFLSKKLGVKVERADLENRSLPDCKVLKKNGETAALFEVKFHGAPFVSALASMGRYCYEGSATLDHKKIEKQLKLIEEKEIKVPVYYVHWIEYPCLKGIFYETKEQVKEYIENQHEVFERKERDGDELKTKTAIYLKKMYSPLLKMNTFEDFLSTLKDLIKE